MAIASSYRPHDPGHDYYDKGIYLITLVVRERERVLGELNMDARRPGVVMTEVGEYVCQQWKKSEALQLKYGNKIEVLAQVAMPDHWHGVIEVKERMSWSLGAIVQAVKSACTSFWRKRIGYEESPLTAKMIRHMSHEERLRYFDSRPRREAPLFDADYDDTICLTHFNPLTGTFTYDERHRAAMIHYVEDNARRAIIRRMKPDFMRRCLHIRVAGRDYAAFGNLFLLRWAKKRQVFCHRKARIGQLSEEEKMKHGYAGAFASDMTTRIPYEGTEAYQKERDAFVAEVLEGATVLVTPGISKGEQLIKNECLDKGYPLIHLQKEPINAYWKPEQQRFDACVNGSLLILAPWKIDDMGDVNGIEAQSDYSRFHNMNALAEEICNFYGEACIVKL